MSAAANTKALGAGKAWTSGTVLPIPVHLSRIFRNCLKDFADQIRIHPNEGNF
jgi:hypothetical protein